MLLTGASGSGKSTLLRRVREEAGRRGYAVVDLARVRLPARRAVVDCLDPLGLDETLRVLALVGLAEAHLYVMRPGDLSEGQRFRLRLAVALARARRARRGKRGRRGPVLVVCDEFAAVLDRVTARVVARAVRRVTGKVGYGHLAFAVATSHGDLQGALMPDGVVECDFGKWRVQGSGVRVQVGR